MNATIIALPVNGREYGSAGQNPAARSVAENASLKLRLTRRGRAVLGALAVITTGIALGFVAMIGAPGASASNSQAESSNFAYVIVQSGDSLWSVASALDPSSDPRDVISEIVRLNQLEESAVQAGQSIAVPLRYSENDRVLSAEQLGL